ncbi:MAG: hypothetical protein AABW51_04030 [Nanoarchaeota archaeon]
MVKKEHHKQKSHHVEHKTHHVEHHQAHHHDTNHAVHHQEHHPQHHKEHHQAPVTINMPAPKETGTNSILLENFVSLQRVMTNLAVKLDDLSSQISKLLELFEISAKALAEKDFDVEKDNKEILERLNGLVDQNKILARGMALMHERIPREQQQYYTPQPQAPYQQPAPQPTQQYMPSLSLIRDMGEPTQQNQMPMQQTINEEIESPSSPSQSSQQKLPFESPL